MSFERPEQNLILPDLARESKQQFLNCETSWCECGGPVKEGEGSRRDMSFVKKHRISIANAIHVLPRDNPDPVAILGFEAIEHCFLRL